MDLVEQSRLIRKAKEALNIREPYWATVDEKTRCVLFSLRSSVKTYCFGDETPEQPEPCEVYKEPDFTTIPGVGKVTAQLLHKRSIHTMAMLRQGWDLWIKRSVENHIPRRAVHAITKYFEEETE